MKHFVDDTTLIQKDEKNVSVAINTVDICFFFFSSGLKLNFERYEGTCLGAVGKDVGEQNKFLL